MIDTPKGRKRLVSTKTVNTIDTTSQPSRQARIKIWLLERGLNHKDLATLAGIDNTYLTRIFSGERRAIAAREKLVSVGFPEDLLPPLEDEAAKSGTEAA